MTSGNNMEEIKLIPTEMLQIIPVYGGDMLQLNLFLRQCEYVIGKYGGGRAQNTYVMHSIMSRLVDRAAALISEHEEIETWADFKTLFTQHFGDPRSEECIYMELQSMRKRPVESFLEFCNRIKSVRSALVAKMGLNTDPHLKQGKITIYDEVALDVFLYNLPENIVTNVRFKSPKTLENALSLVLEEVNFQERYQMRNRNFPPQHTSMPVKNYFGNFNAPSVASLSFGAPQNAPRPQIGQGATFGSQPQGQGGPCALKFGLNTQPGSGSQISGGSLAKFGAEAQSSVASIFGLNKPVEKTGKESNATTDVAPRTETSPEKQERFKRFNLDFGKTEPNQ